MNYKEALDITGDRATWELTRMIRALQLFEIANTPKENQRLVAAKIVLRERNAQIKRLSQKVLA